MPTAALSPTSISKAWNDLATHLKTYFYRPHMQAIDVAFTTAAAHYLCQSDPIWLFVIGPSSSGKTSIVINLLRGLQDAHVLGDVTSKTFISAYKGDQQGGLLRQVKSGIFLFKDFTTILSKREDERTEIAAQLREIYDGCWVRNTGVGAPPMWEGKISTIAVCTPAIERAWAMRRELGERFVTVRWPRVGGFEMARFAAAQRGRESFIAKTTQEIGKRMLDSIQGREVAPLPEAMGVRCAHLAELICHLRASITRDSFGQREIIDMPGIEEPGRLNKALELLVSTHAAMWHRDPTEEDFQLAYTVAWDSVPQNRRAIFSCLLQGAKVSQAEIARFTGIPKATVKWLADELQAIGLIDYRTDIVSAETDLVLSKFGSQLALNSISTLVCIK